MLSPFPPRSCGAPFKLFVALRKFKKNKCRKTQHLQYLKNKMPLSIVPKDMRGSNSASFTEVEHYSRGGAGHSLDTLTRHEGYLSEIYSQGADDILSAAKTSSQEEVLGAIKRTGQKWEVREGDIDRKQRALLLVAVVPTCFGPTESLRLNHVDNLHTRALLHSAWIPARVARITTTSSPLPQPRGKKKTFGENSRKPK